MLLGGMLTGSVNPATASGTLMVRQEAEGSSRWWSGAT
jgi:hypothetical protein